MYLLIHAILSITWYCFYVIELFTTQEHLFQANFFFVRITKSDNKTLGQGNYYQYDKGLLACSWKDKKVRNSVLICFAKFTCGNGEVIIKRNFSN